MGHRLARDADQGQDQRGGDAGAIFPGRAVEDHRGAVVEHLPHQGGVLRREGERHLLVEASHQGPGFLGGCGSLTKQGHERGHVHRVVGLMDRHAHCGRPLDRLGVALIRRAQVDIGADTQGLELLKPLRRNVAKLGRAIDNARLDGATIDGAIAAQVAKVHAAVDQQHMAVLDPGDGRRGLGQNRRCGRESRAGQNGRERNALQKLFHRESPGQKLKRRPAMKRRPICSTSEG